MAGQADDKGAKDKVAKGMDESGKGEAKDSGGKAMKGGSGGGSSQDLAKGMSESGSKGTDPGKGGQ